MIASPLCAGNPVRFPIEPLRTVLLGSFVGSATPHIHGHLIAVEAYPGSVVTFTFQSMGPNSHVYAYLPPHAFETIDKRNEPSVDPIEVRTDIECPHEAPSWSVLPLRAYEGGWGKVGVDRENLTLVKWSVYLGTLDWAQANVMVHVVAHKNAWGEYVPYVIRTSRFQVGGNTWSPPDWKKCRVEWKLPPKG